ncbi:MAG: heavy metal translocating P-type ATPase [Chloroflexota bacterium]
MDNSNTRTYVIQGLDCPECASSLEKAVQLLPGVERASLTFTTSRLTVAPRNGSAPDAAVRQLVADMGYALAAEAAPSAPPVAAPSWRAWLAQHRRDATTGLSAALLVAALVLRVLGASAAAYNGAFVAAIIVGGLYVARAGWLGLVKGRNLDMNALMTIAAVGAIAVGEYAEGAVTILLFSLGELLESYSTDRARHAIRQLMALAPAEATRQTAAGSERVPIAALRLGDRISVRPGERMPMDGHVVEGRSALDQAPITGESVPVDKAVGDDVFAGSINGTGALLVVVTRLAEDNTIARILRLVEEAQAQRAPSQRFVDRFARVYTPVVVALALLIAFVPPLLGLGALAGWVYRALVLLVIACPCALVISTPVTIVSALARAARAGVLIKGGRYLEELAAVRVIAFDKTGTLTVGKPQVVGTACDQHGEDARCAACQELVAKAAAIEERSEHALARAVTAYAQAEGLAGRYGAGEEVVAATGQGIEGRVGAHAISIGSHAYSHRHGRPEDAFCERVVEAERQGHTVLVVEDQCCAQRGYLAVSDALRPEAAGVVAELKRLGVAHTVMLTGDNAHTAQRIGAEVGVDRVYAALLPADKADLVAELGARYGKLAMVGDGVNDAPALARAAVGIAMGAAGADAALETADVALMGDDLTRLPFLLRLSRRTVRILRVNVAFALALKALFMALAVAGVATLWMAVIADVGASLLVTLNGMRLLGQPDPAAARPAR